MIGITTLLVPLLLGPGTLLSDSLDAPDLGVRPESFESAPLHLRADHLGARTGGPSPDLVFAQRRLPPRQYPVPQPPPPPDPTPAPAAQCPPTEAGETCDIDCETCRESDRNSRYVMRRRASLLRTHRGFAIAAWSTMLLTEVLGTIQAVNQDTWFGPGVCAGSPRAFGCQQSTLLTGLHETMAFVTVGLYTASGAIAIAAPDPENASEGDNTAARTLRLHKAMAWVHGVGMVLLPILGIVSATPQIFGVTSDQGRADFTRAVRSVHTIVGYTTFAALTFSAYLELF